MATYKYFSDHGGQPVELERVTEIDNKLFEKLFQGVKGLRFDGYSKYVGYAQGGTAMLPATRKIEYKARPSLHKCNAKCLNGKATGACECQCGGKHHGAGLFAKLGI